MKCRGCGYLATNIVTGLCSECDITITMAQKILEEKGVSKQATYETMQRNLHLGLVSQSTFDLYSDIWGTSVFRYSLSESNVRDAFRRLEILTGRRNNA